LIFQWHAGYIFASLEIVFSSLDFPVESISVLEFFFDDINEEDPYEIEIDDSLPYLIEDKKIKI